MSNSANPYAAPTARVDDTAAPGSEAETIRRAHISHEASVKSVGILYYLGGVLLVIVAVASLFAPRSQFEPLMAAVFAVLGVGQLFAGYGVRALRPWGRVVGTILSVLGLLGFPIGTLINLYILYLFFSKKGRTIFAPGYQEIVAATPHVKYRTSILVWIFLALLVALLLLAIGLPFFARK